MRENVLTVVRARKSKADASLREISIKLGDYISMEQYEDPDLRFKQLILRNFERATLYSVQSIESIARTLTVYRFWDEIEGSTGGRAKDLKASIQNLITRRNQIAHRADRPDEGPCDGHGLRPIDYSWTNRHVRDAETIVHASARIFLDAISALEAEIHTAEEQELARRHAQSA